MWELLIYSFIWVENVFYFQLMSCTSFLLIRNWTSQMWLYFFILPEGSPPPHCTPTHLSASFCPLLETYADYLWNLKCEATFEEMHKPCEQPLFFFYFFSHAPICHDCDDDDDAGTVEADINIDEQRVSAANHLPTSRIGLLFSVTLPAW